MRIVHTESSCGWGGQEIRTLSEAEGLSRRGHQVALLACTASRIHDEALKRGLEAHALPIERKNLKGVLAMRRWLRSHPADIVNTHSSTDTWLTALACATFRPSPRIVRTRHISTDIPRTPATRWLYRSATTHVVTTGETLRSQVLHATGLDEPRVTSIPTGIDLERYTPGDRKLARAALGLPADAFIVGIVATLRSWKGHRFLVDAVAGIDDPHCILVIVGDGPGATNLREQVERLGLTSRVRMPGQQDDVIPWLRAFDVFALPSYANEGIPQAIMQAMACRVPVVTTHAGAIGEIVRDGETGLVVPPRDVEALRLALLRLRGDPALGGKLAENGARQAAQRFSAIAMLDAMERVFREAAARP